jgi:hypothetical protein
VRLEQDGSSGFGPQTWDVAGNETNFFVRDATNGSTLPFRIEPGAPSNALYVDSTGKVGIGKTNPTSTLDVVGNDLSVVPTSGAARLNLANASADTWTLNSQSDGLRITDGTGTTQFRLDTSGNVTITTTGVTCGGGCDLVFQPGFEVEGKRVVGVDLPVLEIAGTVDGQNELGKLRVGIEDQLGSPVFDIGEGGPPVCAQSGKAKSRAATRVRRLFLRRLSFITYLI